MSVFTAPDLEQELLKRERLRKVGGASLPAEEARDDQWPGSPDLDDERDFSTLRRGGPTALDGERDDVDESEDGEDLSKREQGALAALVKIAKGEALTPAERRLIDDERQRPPGGRVAGQNVNAAEGDAEDDSEMTKAETAFMALYDAETALAKAADVTPSQRVRAEEKLREARRELGRQIALSRNEGYAAVERVHREGGKLS